MQTMQSAAQWLGTRVCRWAAAYRAELFCAVPLALLVWFGFFAAPWWAYAILATFLAMSVLLCNPFHVWDRLLPPKARMLMAAGILVGLLPVSFYGVALLAKLFLWALAVGLWAVALWRRPLWLGLWQIRQSPDVDNVLAHLSHDGAWAAARAWEQYGCRETRALLHQTLYAECDETQISRTYMPVYLLGYLHGEKAAAAQNRTAEANQAELTRQAYTIEQQEAEIAELKRARAALLERLEQEQARSYNAGQYAKGLEQQMTDRTRPQEERDAAILDYIEAGHSYTEAGDKFGLSKSGAAAAAKRAKQAASAAD